MTKKQNQEQSCSQSTSFMFHPWVKLFLKTRYSEIFLTFHILVQLVAEIHFWIGFQLPWWMKEEEKAEDEGKRKTNEEEYS